MPKQEDQETVSYEFSDDECKKAAEKAMSLLLYKDRTRKELSDRLYQAGFSETASQEAMGYVERFGYINDRRYAENYIMFQKNKRSKKDILYKLMAKGISKELISQIMEESDPAETDGEKEAIRRLVHKKLKGRQISEISYEERNKIIAFLGRKGFELDGIRSVLLELDNPSQKV